MWRPNRHAAAIAYHACMEHAPHTKRWAIPGSDGELILGNTDTPAGGVEAASGVVLLCHGFKGYKDYGFFPRLATALADAGLIAHRFNFSHSGMTEDLDTFARPDLFESDTWSKQVTDVCALVSAIQARNLDGAGLPLMLFGHSRGGVTALLAAVELGPEVSGIITAAAPHQACSLDSDQRDRLRKSGRLASPSSRTGQTLYVGRAWLDEIEAAPSRFDPVRAAGIITCPHLILHGKEDQTVPWIAAHALHDAPGGNSLLEIIEQAQHTFNAPNPLAISGEAPPVTLGFIDRCIKFAATCCSSSLKADG